MALILGVLWDVRTWEEPGTDPCSPWQAVGRETSVEAKGKLAKMANEVRVWIRQFELSPGASNASVRGQHEAERGQ